MTSQAEGCGLSIVMDGGSRGHRPWGLWAQRGGRMQGMGTVVFLEELRCVLQHLIVLAQLQLALAVVEHQWRDQVLQLQPSILPWLLLPQRAIWFTAVAVPSQAPRAHRAVLC